MKTKYIIFTAGVYPAQSGQLKNAIIQAINDKYDEIYFLISSEGGNVFEGLAIASLIKALPMKTTMHNVGQVDSVATAIFSSGKERVSNKNASFMFHGVSMNLEKSSLLEQQLKEIYDSSKRLKDDIAKAISSYIGLPVEKIQALMIDGGSILSAEKAKSEGFITDIVEANIPADANITVINNA